MEQFFSNNPYALYFIGLLFLIISNRSSGKAFINKNIILVYIIFSLANLFNIIDLKYNIAVILLISFIELQILNLNDETLVVKTIYKIQDYIFTMINKYKFISILLCNIGIEFARSMNINNIAIWIVYFILFIYIISKIYRANFKLKKFEDIEKIFVKNTEGFEYENCLKDENLNTKLNMVIDVEDKTYLFRTRSHSAISLEALMCKINRETEYSDAISKIEEYSVEYFLVNLKTVIKYGKNILITILKAILYKNGIRRFIKRGYSTIEMQWIRNVGIEIGYEKVYRRKIFEITYANIFFKSLEEKRKYYTYPEYAYKESRKIYRMLIIYVYLKTVPTFIFKGEKRIKLNNIFEYYRLVRGKKIKDKNDILNELTKEEIFIFIMGLSGKKIDENLYELYDWYIAKYGIDIDKVTEILNKLSKNNKKIYRNEDIESFRKI